MDENFLRKLLNNTFPSADKETWRQTAISELNGNEPFEKLAWQDDDKNVFSPYYSAEDSASLGYLGSFQLNPPANLYAGNRAWNNLAVVAVTSAAHGNKKALEHLTNGADGILFDLSQQPKADLDALLQDIQWPYCTLSFTGMNPEHFLTELDSFFTDKKFSDSELMGNLFWETIPQKRITASGLNHRNLKTLGCVIQSSTPVKEITDALMLGVNMLDQSDDSELTKNIHRVSFSVPVRANLLVEISKLKALRILWYQVARAYHAEDYNPDDLHVHARSQTYTRPEFQPHANMLNSTIASLAGILGGCDSLTVYAEEANNVMMERMARNVSSILREESHLNKVSDPTAGAYSIDVMTDIFAKQAWTTFQRLIKKDEA